MARLDDENDATWQPLETVITTRYVWVDKPVLVAGRGLHSSTFRLNLSRFGHSSPCAPV